MYTDYEKFAELDTETTLALSELVLQNIKSARNKLKQIIKKMDDIEKYREQEVSHFDKDAPARIVRTEVLADINDLCYEFRWGAESLAKRATFAAVDTLPPYRIPNPVKSEALHSDAILPAIDLDCALENDVFYLRLPMLWSRNNKLHKTAYGYNIGPEQSRMYKEVIGHAILKMPNCDDLFDRFTRKTFHYTFVYPDSKKKSYFIIDSDNHETKSVTDAVARFTKGHDDAQYCDFVYTTLLTNELPEGTYLTVFPSMKMSISDEKLIEFWKERIAKNPK